MITTADDFPTLPAAKLYRARPGHPDLARLDAEADDLARAIAPHLEPPQARLARLDRRRRSVATAVRNFRHNRRLQRERREDLLPLYFIWTVHRACNFDCDYCDDHRGRKYPDLPTHGELTTDEALRLLRIMRTSTPSVYFAGGEPTLRKDLPRLTRAARDLDFDPIIVNSNGSAFDRLLQRPAWSGFMADVDICVVSLDGLDLGTLAEMWVYRRPEDVIRNLLLLRKLAPRYGLKLMVNTVIQPGRIEHARAVLDLVNDLGIWFCPVPMNTGPTVSHELAVDPEYAELAALILARQKAGFRISGSPRMNRRLLHSEPLDCRNTLKPHVDHDGTLFWPCKASVNVPPQQLRVLDHPDVASIWAEGRRRVDPTGFCGSGAGQCGARCNWAQNYSTDAYAHGLAHPTSLLRDVVSFLRPS